MLPLAFLRFGGSPKKERMMAARSIAAGPRDLVAANFKRAEEAIRSIEEQTREEWRSVSRGAHRIRFFLYTVESRMRGPRGRVASARVYVLLDSKIARAPLEKVAERVLRGGAGLLQLREEGSDRKLVKLASRLATIAHEYKALFLVNNRADIAVASGADGVHVGATDLPIEAARGIVGEWRIVGATSHSISGARHAKRLGADYVSVGPIFPSTTKPDLSARGFSYLKQVRRLGIPHFCIGGITPRNATPEMNRVAVCAGVIAEKDPAAAVRAILHKLALRGASRKRGQPGL